MCHSRSGLAHQLLAGQEDTVQQNTDILTFLLFPVTRSPFKQLCDGVLEVKGTNSRSLLVQ